MHYIWIEDSFKEHQRHLYHIVLSWSQGYLSLGFSVNIAEFGSLFGFYSSRFFFFIILIEFNILWCWWHWILFLLIFFCCFVILCFHSCFHCKSNTLNFKTLYIFTKVKNTVKSTWLIDVVSHLSMPHMFIFNKTKEINIHAVQECHNSNS